MASVRLRQNCCCTSRPVCKRNALLTESHFCRCFPHSFVMFFPLQFCKHRQISHDLKPSHLPPIWCGLCELLSKRQGCAWLRAWCASLLSEVWSRIATPFRCLRKAGRPRSVLVPRREIAPRPQWSLQHTAGALECTGRSHPGHKKCQSQPRLPKAQPWDWSRQKPVISCRH